jgi:hypothetical protein
MKPPVDPMALMNGEDPDEEDSKKPGDEEDPKKEKPEEEDKEKDMGKSKRVLRINRNRKTLQNAIADLSVIVLDALKKDAEEIASSASEEVITKAKKDYKLKEVKKQSPKIKKKLYEIYVDGAKQAELQIGTNFNRSQLKQVNTEATKWAERRAGELMKGLDQTTSDNVKSIVSKALETGVSPQSLADEIRNSFSFSEHRSMMIARTELAFADVKGNIKGWKESGVVKRKTWIASEGCCDDCAELDNVTVDLEEDFPNGGGDGPPFHPQCECDVVPEIE